MPVWGNLKNWHVCWSSTRVIGVIGLVKVGSGREVVDAMMRGPRRGGDDDEGRGTGASAIRNLIRI